MTAEMNIALCPEAIFSFIKTLVEKPGAVD